jgi:hypothetical protein
VSADERRERARLAAIQAVVGQSPYATEATKVAVRAIVETAITAYERELGAVDGPGTPLGRWRAVMDAINEREPVLYKLVGWSMVSPRGGEGALFKAFDKLVAERELGDAVFLTAEEREAILYHIDFAQARRVRAPDYVPDEHLASAREALSVRKRGSA